MGQASLSRAQVGYFFADDWRYERSSRRSSRRPASPGTKPSDRRATLQALAERLSRKQARELAAELPPPLGEWLSNGGPRPEPFNADDSYDEWPRGRTWIPSAPPGTCGRYSSPWREMETTAAKHRIRVGRPGRVTLPASGSRPDAPAPTADQEGTRNGRHRPRCQEVRTALAVGTPSAPRAAPIAASDRRSARSARRRLRTLLRRVGGRSSYLPRK
jgi:hypothetical protein